MDSLKTHTDIINFLIHRYGLKTYLEIGVQFKKNFNAININESNKVGVDPDESMQATFVGTSDEYFSGNISKFDLIFIDGYHSADQVEKDFNNALEIINENGFIVLHDTVPLVKEWTLIPRVSRQWTGDVYKFACSLSSYDNIDFKTFPFDYGVTVVWKSKNPSVYKVNDIDWNYYTIHKSKLLRFDNNLPVR